GTRIDYGRIVLEPLHALTVRVVHGARPVPGAQVVVGDARNGRAGITLHAATSDADGLARFEGVSGAGPSMGGRGCLPGSSLGSSSRAGQTGRACVPRRARTMTDFHRIWVEQCEAAEDIRARYGEAKALGYLIGEKLVAFVRAADTRPEFAAELPAFSAEVRRIFGAEAIRTYLDGIRRVGPFAPIGTEGGIAEMRAGGMCGEEDPVADAEDILIVERIKEWLLP
ncbi:MAG: hypothetical protein ACC662_12245, partial [Planctomycetota bacterium]